MQDSQSLALSAGSKETEAHAHAVVSHYCTSCGAEQAHYRPYALQAIKILLGKSAAGYTEQDCENALNERKASFAAEASGSFKFIDLFAGAGGFRLAMQELGGLCVFTSEWNPAAQHTYSCNFGQTPFGDITSERTKELIPGGFDILCAGFPCQAFSIAGLRKGFTETRGTLFFDLEQIIEKHRPKAVFLENVKNLLSHDKGKTFRVILEILEAKLGYKVYYKVLNSMCHAGIPQNRERIFIIGFNPEQVPGHESFEFPGAIDLTSSVTDYLSGHKPGSKYYYHPGHRYYPQLESSVLRSDTVYQWRRVYVRENKSNVCPTLTANMGAGGHNVPLIRDSYGIRKLTPAECFALQGFPKDRFCMPAIADSKLYMQAGNSVTVPLISRIGANIIAALEHMP
jgi:DNA (cytosine-5)-methyltransferase 1